MLEITNSYILIPNLGLSAKISMCKIYNIFPIFIKLNYEVQWVNIEIINEEYYYKQ